MRSLAIIWVLAIITLAGAVQYANHCINAQLVVPELYMAENDATYVTEPSQPITISGQLQFASYGVEFLQGGDDNIGGIVQ